MSGVISSIRTNFIRPCISMPLARLAFASALSLAPVACGPSAAPGVDFQISGGNIPSDAGIIDGKADAFALDAAHMMDAGRLDVNIDVLPDAKVADATNDQLGPADSQPGNQTDAIIPDALIPDAGLPDHGSDAALADVLALDSQVPEAAPLDAGKGDATPEVGQFDATGDAVIIADAGVGVDGAAGPDAPVSCPLSGNTLQVPSLSYPDIPTAIAASQAGDTVQIAAGTYNLFNATMKYCTRLVGAGRDQTLIEYQLGPDPDPFHKSMLNAGDKCIVSGVRLTLAGVPTPDDFDIYALTLEGDAKLSDSKVSATHIKGNGSPTVEDSDLDGVYIIEQTTPTIQYNTLGNIVYKDASGGVLSGNNFPTVLSYVMAGGSAPLKLRGNNFYVINDPNQPNTTGVWITGSTQPDLGTDTDPGNNVFNNQAPAGNLRFSIYNGTSLAVSARGNSFEQRTFDEMTANPDPNDAAANISTLWDVHDGSQYGMVDYRDFKLYQ
ncbi:MAG TPA: hypothetical protein VMD02_03630 [Candidatus Omnitrophota bacterium]|nr:hypothetical protein [Candidatus Omnitrophota bacterium]